jgi:hypothetical protein
MKKKRYVDFLLIILICAGLFEYFKIGKSLVGGTLTNSFINSSPFALNAGENSSLPTEVINAKKLIHRNSLQIFLLDKKFTTDPFLYQRVIEFSYPAKLGSSVYFIGMANGELKSKCNLIDTEENVAAYVCK